MSGFLFAGCVLALTVLLSCGSDSEDDMAKASSKVRTKAPSLDDAVALLQAGNYAEARDIFRAVDVKAPNCDALAGAAECSYFLNDDEDCLNCCDVLFFRRQRIGRGELLVGLVLKRRGETERAKIAFQAAVADGDDVAIVHLRSMARVNP